MSVRIGINPLSWTNDDMPELGSETSLSTCLSEGKQAGYSGFELGNKFPRKAEVLGPILKEYDLSLVSGWFSGKLLQQDLEAEIAGIQEHLDLLKALGATDMVYCDVTSCVHGDRDRSLSERPIITDPEVWASWGANLTKLAEYTLSQGVRLAYHHHMGTVVQSELDVDKLMENTGDALGLLLDTGHLLCAGGDPIAVQKRYVSRINHVHCKDVRRHVLDDITNRGKSFLNSVLDGLFTVPGDGCVDYPTLFKALKESDYSGWIVVEAEQDPAVANPLKYATLGYKNLRQLCADAGIEVEA